MPQKKEKVEISRLKMGSVSAICLTVALILSLTRGGNSDNDLWLAGLVRVGVLCAAFCLALPGKSQKAAWANVSPTIAWGLLIMLIVLIRVPLKAFFILLPIIIIALFLNNVLRPKPKSRPGNRTE